MNLNELYAYAAVAKKHLHERCRVQAIHIANLIIPVFNSHKNEGKTPKVAESFEEFSLAMGVGA